MKHIIIWCTVLALQGLPALAQQLPGGTSSDPLWQQATAGNALDLRVFGRQARNEERFRQLVERFESADTTLSFTDFLILYYGSAYRDEYNGGYEHAADRRSREQEPVEAYRLCAEALERHPASPALLSRTLALAERADRPREELDRLDWRRKMLLWTIEALGNGTQESPFIVMSVADEYEILHHRQGVDRIVSQKLVDNPDGTPCDRLEVSTTEQAPTQIKEFWFDVSYPLATLTNPHHWTERLNGEEKR